MYSECLTIADNTEDRHEKLTSLNSEKPENNSFIFKLSANGDYY